MRGRAGIAIALTGAVLGAVPAASNADGLQEETPVARQMIVRLDAGADRARVLAALRARFAHATVRDLGIARLAVVRLPSAAARSAALALAPGLPGVAQAEADSYASISGAPVDDPGFGSQWGLQNTGQTVNGAPSGAAGEDVEAVPAWQHATGKGAVVAIIDTGVQYTHPDLRANIWTNPGESGDGREDNGKDDDGNGFVDDVHGWDFVDHDNRPLDENGHGTHVAGIIAAQANNAIGVAGVAPDAKLMIIRAGNAGGSLARSDVIASYAYAKRMGARVANASFGGAAPSGDEKDAVADLGSTTVLVAAAGNAGVEAFQGPYPCSYDVGNVICVTAIDQTGNIASFATSGNQFADLAAPGSDVLSTFPSYRTLARDTIESDLSPRWDIVNGPWSTSPHAASAPYSLTDGPGGTVPPDTVTEIDQRSVTDLAGQRACQVTYLANAHLPGNDRLSVVASDGDGWTTVQRLRGTSAGRFVRLTAGLGPDFDGKQVKVGFTHTTDSATDHKPVEIDDVEIRCSDPNGAPATEYLSGTSMATPHVTGVAALVAGQLADAQPDEIRGIVLGHVRPSSKVTGSVATNGVANAANVLDTVPPLPFTMSGASGASRNTDPSFTWTGTSDERVGMKGYQLLIDGDVVREVGKDAREASPAHPLADGSHQAVVRALDRANNPRDTDPVAFTIDTTAPVVKAGLTVSQLRRLARTRSLPLPVGSDEAATITLRITIMRRRGTRPIATLTRTLSPSEAGSHTVSLGLTLRQRRIARRALRAGGLRATIVVSATDALGNATSKTARASARH